MWCLWTFKLHLNWTSFTSLCPLASNPVIGHCRQLVALLNAVSSIKRAITAHIPSTLLLFLYSTDIYVQLFHVYCHFPHYSPLGLCCISLLCVFFPRGSLFVHILSCLPSESCAHCMSLAAQLAEAEWLQWYNILSRTIWSWSCNKNS